jgi:type IV pilus assembly protein PilE
MRAHVISPGDRGVTLLELVIVLVVLTVLAAIAVPMWQTHTLRVRRTDAIEALSASQTAQDGFFGRHARYAQAGQLALAVPEGLGLSDHSPRGHYRLELRVSDDGLGYLAVARPMNDSVQSADTRCAEFSIDHNGRRRAVDAGGADRSADCWR